MSMLFLEGGPRQLSPDLMYAEELPRYGVNKAYFLDFDDTMSITSAGLDGLLAICEARGYGGEINEAVIEAKRQDAWNQETPRSYDVLELLEEKVPEAMDDIRRSFRAGHGAYPMAYEDGKRLAQRLNAKVTTPNLILTYGPNVDMYPDGGLQRDKIERFNNQCALPIGFAYLLAHSDKAPVIEDLYDMNGVMRFFAYDHQGRVVALYEANEAALIDDRKDSLSSASSRCEPLWLRRPEEEPKKKQLVGELPDHGKRINSLDEVEVDKTFWPLNETAERAEPPEVAAFVPAKLLFDRYIESADAA